MQETVDRQSQKSSYPLLYKGNDSKLIQYDPIQEVNQLLSLLSASDTEKIWVFFKKAIVLLLFLICFVIALPIWLYGIGFQAGFHFREWIDTEKPPIEKIVDLVLGYLSWPFTKAYAWASWFVKQYFDWEFPFGTSATKSESSLKSQ